MARVPSGVVIHRSLRFVLGMVALCATVVLAFGATPASAQAEDRATFGGVVVDGQDGTPVAGMTVALYNQTNLGERGTFIGSLATETDGSYAFVNRNPKCYVVSFEAPAGRTIGGVAVSDVGLCVEAGDLIEDLDASLDPIAPTTGTIIAELTASDSNPVAGAQVELFNQNEDGTRGDLVEAKATGETGRADFDVEPGCYLLNVVAPAGQTIGGNADLEREACVELDGQTVLSAVLDEPQIDTSIGGSVSAADGSPVFDAKVDLFAANPDGSRGAFLGFVRTDSDGNYSFDVEPGCHVLTFIAPDGETFNGSRWFQPSACVELGQVVTDLDAVLDAPVDPSDDATIGGLVALADADGTPVAGVKIDLFVQGDSGGRGSFVGFANSGDDGRYSFTVEAGCYVLTFIAPGDASFGGSRWFQPSVCVDPAETNDGLNATLQLASDFASLGGVVTDADGAPVEGLKVTYWGVRADGGRGEFAGRAFSNTDGVFAKDVTGGCHWLVFVAPEGASFNETPFLEAFRCLEAGEVVTDLNASLD